MDTTTLSSPVNDAQDDEAGPHCWAPPPDDPVWFDLFGTAEDDDLAWRERALCAQVDPELFFPDKGGSTREAKQVCLACPVRAECLEYALTHDERFGIWGGLSERERRKLKHHTAPGPRPDEPHKGELGLTGWVTTQQACDYLGIVSAKASTTLLRNRGLVPAEDRAPGRGLQQLWDAEQVRAVAV